jgi:hypothetical protein
MERKIVSKSGNSVAEEKMGTQALNDAKTWLETLHDAEFRGRKDTDGAARYRLATRLGVKENYLFRLQYRAAEMKDVAGEVYRRLGIAYADLCKRVENAADAMERERREIEGKDATDRGSAPGGAGMARAPASAEREMR